MRRVLFVLACALAPAAVTGGCGRSTPASSSSVAPAEAAKLLVDRNWIDRMPEHHDDRLHVYRFVPSMGGGVYQDRTVFKGSFELFVFAVDGASLEVRLPDTGERVRTGFTIERVAGPAPFDLRLTLAHAPRGPRVYYGIAAEADRTGAALEARLAELP
ncbi:MAG: hypothetical protein R2939_01185 [Kofleriaceae bacterium]